MDTICTEEGQVQKQENSSVLFILNGQWIDRAPTLGFKLQEYEPVNGKITLCPLKEGRQLQKLPCSLISFKLQSNMKQAVRHQEIKNHIQLHKFWPSASSYHKPYISSFLINFVHVSNSSIKHSFL